MNLDTSVLLPLWNRLSPLPMGKWTFMRLFYQIVPYSGSTNARIVELKAGHCKLELPNRRKNRNHLKCLHAIAIANVGELCTGLAVLTGLSKESRGIVKGLSVKYMKKARGTITVEANFPPSNITSERTLDTTAVLRDSSGDVVAEVTANWLVGPKNKDKRAN